MNRCVKVELKKFLKPIKNLSFDKDNKISLCNFENAFLDFEEIVKLKKSKELPKAVDMLFLSNKTKEIWFVEFKNRSKNDVKKYDVKRKILDSLIAFYELFDKKLCCEYEKKYFVVYKCEEDVHFELYSEFEDREIYFDLKEIKNKFLEEVITDCCKVFLDVFNNRYGIKWKGA